MAICDPSPAEAIRQVTAQEGLPLVTSPEEVWRTFNAVLVSSSHGVRYLHATAPTNGGVISIG